MQFAVMDKENGRDFHFIRLISPTTDPARRSEILREANGFVYCVLRRGVTGNLITAEPRLRFRFFKGTLGQTKNCSGVFPLPLIAP